MNEMERLVWAAAFANEFARERRFLHETPIRHDRTIDNIGGFSCAEVADVALEKYREAIDGPDREYLLPVKERWSALAAQREGDDGE